MSGDHPKLALVTGGVRRVGAAIASRLATAGYTLALHGHSDAQPDDELSRVLKEQGSDWSGFTADFGAKNAASGLLDDVFNHFSRVPDLIVNSASVFGQDDFLGLDDDTLEKHMRINFVAPVRLATELAKRIKGENRAAIIHILDQRVNNPNRDQVSYTLSKQALAQSVRTLAVTCADKLRVNGVAPGLTLTAGEYGEQQLANITDMMPLDRLPKPEEIADAVFYLAEAEAVTGQVICVDGGANLKSFDRDFVHLGK